MDKLQTLHEIAHPDVDVYPNIKPANIPSGAVDTSKLADSAVTTAKIADSNVTSAKIADGAIGTVKIADEAITTAKIADDAITTDKIVDANITTAKIADGAITTVKIVNKAVTLPKIKRASGKITDLISDEDWSDERYFADAVDYYLGNRARFFLVYNTYRSEVQVAVSPFQGVTYFNFMSDVVTVPTSSTIVGGIATLSIPSELSTFRTDVGDYLYIEYIEEN